MDEVAERLVGRAWTDEFPWRVLTRLTEVGTRLGGHPGERRAATLVAEAFEDAGADPVVELFETRRWTRGETALAVSFARDGESIERSFETVALPYAPAGEVRGSLVDGGHGTPGELDDCDLAGSIVLVRTDAPPDGRQTHRMESFGHAVAGGASAVVFASHVPGQLPPTGALAFGHEAAVPGVGVSHETGAWLAEYATERATATVRVEARTEPATSRNVVGALGPDTDESVLVVAHYDAHDLGEGAIDNGAGTAVLATVARLLGTGDVALDRRVRLAAVSCEETGLGGSEALADRLDTDALQAVVNVDGAGRARNLRAYTHGSPAVRRLTERVLDDVGHPFGVEETPHPYSDHWPFLRAGVPALQLHSQPPDRNVGGTDFGVRGPQWAHTAADTRDKIDGRDLREHAALAALLVRELATADRLPRVASEDLAARLRESDAEPGMRAAGVWPDEWDEERDQSQGEE